MPTNIMYKVGETARVRSWESMEKEFGLDANGDIYMPPSRMRISMKEFCGQVIEITEIKGAWCRSIPFSTYWFHAAMLEPEFMIGDVVECIDATSTLLYRRKEYTVNKVEHGDSLGNDCIGFKGIDRIFNVNRFKLIRRGYKDYSNVTSERTQKFYMVYCEDLPWGKYPTLEIARTEAERLARKYPCRKMFILETVECFLCSVGVLENLYLEEL